LLTIAWYVSVMGGAVDYDPSSGKLNCKKPSDAPEDWEKLSSGATMQTSAVGVKKTIQENCLYMVGTLTPLILVQVGAFAKEHAIQQGNLTPQEGQQLLNFCVLIGFVLTVCGFCWYLRGQYLNAEDNDIVEGKILEAIQTALRSDILTIEGAVADVAKLDPHGHYAHSQALAQPFLQAGGGDDSKEQETLYMKLQQVLKPYFKKYDQNGDGVVDFDEFRVICSEVSHSATKEAQRAIFNRMDVDKNGTLDFDEFIECMLTLTRKAEEYKKINEFGDSSSSGSGSDKSSNADKGGGSDESGSSDEDGDDDEAEDVPEELKHLSPEEQQTRIKLKAAWMCLTGTVLVVIFSDPMVDVLANIGTRTGVPPFFVSFVLSPLVSNASELVAAYNYAKKKTMKSATISLSTLEGAACMNNTFCLGIFLFVIFWGQLNWAFTCETLNVVVVELIVAYVAWNKDVHTLFEATLILMLFPISMVGVWVGTHIFGLS